MWCFLRTGRSDHGRQTGLRGILGSVIQKAHLTTNLGSWILIQVPVSFIPNHFSVNFSTIVHSVSKHQLEGKRIFKAMFVSVQLRIEFRANPEFFLILLWTTRSCGFRGLHFKTAVNTEYVWRTGKVFNFVIIIIVSFQFQGIRSCSWKFTVTHWKVIVTQCIFQYVVKICQKSNHSWTSTFTSIYFLTPIEQDIATTYLP